MEAAGGGVGRGWPGPSAVFQVQGPGRWGICPKAVATVGTPWWERPKGKRWADLGQDQVAPSLMVASARRRKAAPGISSGDVRGVDDHHMKPIVVAIALGSAVVGCG